MHIYRLLIMSANMMGWALVWAVGGLVWLLWA